MKVDNDQNLNANDKSRMCAQVARCRLLYGVVYSDYSHISQRELSTLHFYMYFIHVIRHLLVDFSRVATGDRFHMLPHTLRGIFYESGDAKTEEVWLPRSNE